MPDHGGSELWTRPLPEYRLPDSICRAAEGNNDVGNPTYGPGCDTSNARTVGAGGLIRIPKSSTGCATHSASVQTWREIAVARVRVGPGSSYVSMPRMRTELSDGTITIRAYEPGVELAVFEAARESAREIGPWMRTWREGATYAKAAQHVSESIQVWHTGTSYQGR